MKEVVTIHLNCTPPNCPNISEFIIEPLYVYNKAPNFVLICFYVPIILAALISNLSIIVVVNRYRCLRSVRNYYLVNLSVSDLLITLLCMPMAVGQATYSLWAYGGWMCKLTNYLQGVSVCAEVLTISAMSLDRYMSIQHPLSRINRSRRLIILAIWMLALAVFTPVLFVRKTEGFRFAWDVESREFLHCVESWSNIIWQRAFGVTCFVIIYAIPECTVVAAHCLMGLQLSSQHLTFEYPLTHIASTIEENNTDRAQANSFVQMTPAEGRLSQERRRLAKTLLVLALVFVVCWLPYSVLTLLLDFANPDTTQLANFTSSLIPFFLLLGHVNSVANPILCCVLSKKVQTKVLHFLRHPIRTMQGS